MSEESSLGRSSLMLASGTIVSRVLGFVKAIVLALTIGQVSSAAADAFGVANQLPNNIYALIAGGVLGAVLVPQIVRAGLDDDGGQRFINKIVTLGVVLFLGITLVATLAAPLLINLYTHQSTDGGPGFSAEATALATAFAYWCLPQIFFYALYSLLGEVLNARRVFGPFAWAPALNNVVAIAGLIVFMVLFGGADANNTVDTWTPDRIALLAGSATAGIAVQALVLILFWKRAGLGFSPDFRWRGVGLARTGRAASWVFGMILVTQLVGILQTQVASLATTEGASTATLQNSWLIFMLPHSVIAVSIATVYFTRMSSHATRGEVTEVRADLSASLRTIGLLITFAAVVLVVVAQPFARIFERDFSNVLAMAAVIMAYMVGLVPFSASFVMQRTFYALEDTRTVFVIEVIKSALFAAGFLYCATLPAEQIGVGIALVSSAAFFAQAGFCLVFLRRRLGALGGRMLLLRHLQYLAAAVLSGAVGVLVYLGLGGPDEQGFALSSVGGAIVTMAVVGIAMAVLYFGVLFLLRVPERRGVVSILLRRDRPDSSSQ